MGLGGMKQSLAGPSDTSPRLSDILALLSLPCPFCCLCPPSSPRAGFRASNHTPRRVHSPRAPVSRDAAQVSPPSPVPAPTRVVCVHILVGRPEVAPLEAVHRAQVAHLPAARSAAAQHQVRVGGPQ